MWDLVPDQESNQGPLHWEHRVLTTGPPGSSLSNPHVKGEVSSEVRKYFQLNKVGVQQTLWEAAKQRLRGSL